MPAAVSNPPTQRSTPPVGFRAGATADRIRARESRTVFLVAAVLLAAALPASAQTPVTAGFRDFNYGTSVTSAVTGEKAESKLWWNDGAWWGSLFSPAADRYRIHRFDPATQSWTDTGTSLDDRRNTKADTLWDEASGQLYVVSHVFSTSAAASSSSSNWARLYRFSYSSAQQRYTLDSGFPVHVTRGTAEVLTIARDSTGRLWVTHVESGRVKVNWSLSSDLDWGTPVDLPVSTTAIGVNSDDISAVLAFGGARVGVMWSNQKTRSVYFAHRWDTDVPAAWQLETVLPNAACPSGSCADDHINLATDSSGRVFGVVKTGLGSTSPIILLVVRPAGGGWTGHTVNVGADGSTRPIVVLEEDRGRLHVATASNGSIYRKTTPIDQIAFPSGRGELLVSSALDGNINNPTSTRQNVSATTGLLVLASDASTRRYLHNFLPLGGTPPPPPTPPSAPVDLSATAVSSTRVDLAWTDTSSNETAFHIERASGSGTFGEIATVAANVESFHDTTASADTTYEYRVRAANGAGLSAYSNIATATTPAPGAAVPVKDVTFEGGSLTDATTGMTMVTGAVSLETSSPLKGSYSAGFPNVSSAYLQEPFDAVDDLYVSVYIRPRAIPASDARILLISNQGASVGNLVLRSNGRVRLRQASTTLGESAALEAGQLYRLGIRQRRGTGGNAVLEGYLASGDQEFGAPFAVKNDGTWTTPADRLRVGATTGTIDVVVDDIRLASGAMPGPSGGGTPTVPDAPANLSANAVSSSRIDLSWTDRSGNETSFRIERRTGGSFAEIASVGSNVTSFSDATVTASTAYEYRVRARNAVGDSAYSNTAGATTPGGSTAPSAPTALSATVVSGTRVDLAWNDNSTDETAFHIERATSGGPFVETATVGANVTTYGDTSVAAGTTYSYRVRAGAGQVFSPYSNTVQASTPGDSGGTSIKDITFEDGSLTGGSTGADRATSAVVLETGAPLSGAYSARIPGIGATYVEEKFDSAGDLFVSLLVSASALPSADVRLVQITNAGTTVGNLMLRTSGRLRLRVGSTVIGSESVPLAPGEIYRVGLRQKAGSGTNAVIEAFVAPAGSAFGAPFAGGSGGSWITAADRVRIGATASSSVVVDVTLDDIRLANGAMAQP